MSKFEKGPIARTHEEARRIVCCCCGKKCKCIKNTGSAFIVTERFSGLVRRFVEATYSDQNPEHPVALCDSCRLALSAHEKVIDIILYEICIIILAHYRIQRSLLESYLNFLATLSSFHLPQLLDHLLLQVAHAPYVPLLGFMGRLTLTTWPCRLTRWEGPVKG